MLMEEDVPNWCNVSALNHVTLIPVSVHVLKQHARNYEHVN